MTGAFADEGLRSGDTGGWAHVAKSAAEPGQQVPAWAVGLEVRGPGGPGDLLGLGREWSKEVSARAGGGSTYPAQRAAEIPRVGRAVAGALVPSGRAWRPTFQALSLPVATGTRMGWVGPRASRPSRPGCLTTTSCLAPGGPRWGRLCPRPRPVLLLPLRIPAAPPAADQAPSPSGPCHLHGASLLVPKPLPAAEFPYSQRDSRLPVPGNPLLPEKVSQAPPWPRRLPSDSVSPHTSSQPLWSSCSCNNSHVCFPRAFAPAALAA